MRRLIVLLAGALVGMACGGSGRSEAPKASEARGSDAAEAVEVKGCALVTKEEVAAAVGAAVSDGEEHSLAGCRWKAPSCPQVRLDVYGDLEAAKKVARAALGRISA